MCARARAIYIKRAAPREIVKERSIIPYAVNGNTDASVLCTGQKNMSEILSYKFSLDRNDVYLNAVHVRGIH